MSFSTHPSPPRAYDPECRDQPDRFNLYRGMAVVPGEGDIKPYLDFVRTVIADESPNHFDYVMAWQANIVQHPTEKSGTSLVLRGDQGIGKGVLRILPWCRPRPPFHRAK